MKAASYFIGGIGHLTHETFRGRGFYSSSLMYT